MRERVRARAATPRITRPTRASRHPPIVDRLVELQRTAGNHAVTDLLVQRKAAHLRPTIRQGSTGDPVFDLQSRLNRSEAATPLAVDGIFGPITARAVREFQTARGLTPDAIVGPKTWTAVDASRAEIPDPEAQARKLFERGAEAYARGRFAHAYDFFTRAHELDRRSGLLFSRAQALRKLGGRREEAIALYRQHIAEGGARAAESAHHIADLEGPKATGDEATDEAAGRALFQKGAAFYAAREFAHAYDEFTKAYELTGRRGLLFSRAQALRKLGGRREEAIALYRQHIAEGGARAAESAHHIADLEGPKATGDEATDEAAGRALFQKGAAFYEAREFAHAYDEFTKAYELTGRTGLLFSRAQALRKLGGRREEAIALYQQHIAEGGSRSSDAAFWRDELREQGAAP